MNHILLYLKIRSLQLFRYCSSSGWVLLLFALIVMFGLIFRFLGSVSKLNPGIQALFIVTILYYIHSSRTDLIRFKSIFNKPIDQRIVLCIEYCIVSTLIIAPLVFINGMISIALFALPILFSIFIPIKKIKSSSLKISQFQSLPLDCFELRAFARKNQLSFILLLTLNFLGFLHISILILICILWASLIVSCYTIFEPLEWLRRMTLGRKIFLNVIWFLLLMSPGFIGGFMAYPEHWKIIVYLLISISMLVCLVIAYKYAQYHPLRYRLTNSSFYGLIVCFFILPGLILANLLLSIYYWFQAKSNLKHYYA